MKRLLISFFLALAFGSVAAELKLPPYSRTVLSNGVVLLLMEQHEVPMVSFSVLISAGSTSDPKGKEGLASLTSELLTRGTTTRSAEQVASEVDFLGGALHFSTGLDFTSGGAEFLAKDTRAGVELLSDVLLNPAFLEAEVTKRIAQSVDELKQEKDEPQTVITNYFHAFLFGDHPYGRAIDGDERSVAAIKRDDIAQFYRTHYTAQNIRISAVGDFSTPEMERLLSERFSGRAKSRESARLNLPPHAPVKGRKLLLVDKPDATQTFYAIGNVGIARTNRDRVAIQLVNTIFGGRFTSILNDELRVSSGLTYGARSQFGRYLQPGPFAISSFTQNSKTAEAIDLTLSVLKRFHENGLTDEQLKSAKAYIKGQFPPQIETSDHLAALLTQLDFFGLDAREINDLFAQIDAVTVEDSRRIIQTYFPAEDLVFVLVGKAAEIKGNLGKYASKIETREISQIGFK
ncbi:MAG TPA: pitrilysin family protein [Verrucomicrobiae bacterium]|nr:pitrilysin family protein [Verrucomicrobiae bacterium]